MESSKFKWVYCFYMSSEFSKVCKQKIIFNVDKAGADGYNLLNY